MFDRLERHDDIHTRVVEWNAGCVSLKEAQRLSIAVGRTSVFDSFDRHVDADNRPSRSRQHGRAVPFAACDIENGLIHHQRQTPCISMNMLVAGLALDSRHVALAAKSHN